MNYYTRALLTLLVVLGGSYVVVFVASDIGKLGLTPLECLGVGLAIYLTVVSFAGAYLATTKAKKIHAILQSLQSEKNGKGETTVNFKEFLDKLQSGKDDDGNTFH